MFTLVNTKQRAATGANTVAKIEPPELATSAVLPEFGRIEDVERIFGIKRGPCYKHLRRGDFKSVLLREAGAKNGTRLVYSQSAQSL
jgi:hypothetical protein